MPTSCSSTTYIQSYKSKTVTERHDIYMVVIVNTPYINHKDLSRATTHKLYVLVLGGPFT